MKDGFKRLRVKAKLLAFLAHAIDIGADETAKQRSPNHVASKVWLKHINIVVSAEKFRQVEQQLKIFLPCRRKCKVHFFQQRAIAGNSLAGIQGQRNAINRSVLRHHLLNLRVQLAGKGFYRRIARQITHVAPRKYGIVFLPTTIQNVNVDRVRLGQHALQHVLPAFKSFHRIPGECLPRFFDKRIVKAGLHRQGAGRSAVAQY